MFDGLATIGQSGGGNKPLTLKPKRLLRTATEYKIAVLLRPAWDAIIFVMSRPGALTVRGLDMIREKWGHAGHMTFYWIALLMYDLKAMISYTLTSEGWQLTYEDESIRLLVNMLFGGLYVFIAWALRARRRNMSPARRRGRIR